MVNRKIVDYINQNVRKGYSKSHIKDFLIKKGFPRMEIEEACNYSNPPKPDPTDLGYFAKLSGIILHPRKTLGVIKSERGIKNPLLFVVYNNILYFLATITFGAIENAFQGKLVYFLLGLTIAVPLFLLQGMLVLSATFILPGIVHLFVKLLGGKEAFNQTYKAFVYPGVFFAIFNLVGLLFNTFAGPRSAWPFSLFVIWVVIGIAIFIWTIILIDSCLAAYTELSSWRLIAVGLLSFLVIFLIFLLPAGSVLINVRYK